MRENLEIRIPDRDIELTPGCRVRLGRFDSTVWELSHGWYSWGGNRPVCGWFLSDICDTSIVKPLQLTDLDDIYFVEK